MTLVPDVRGGDGSAGDASLRHLDLPVQSWAYRVAKRAFDLAFTTALLLPATLVVALALLILNPRFNPGRLLFAQKRMGRDCRPFRALKFRTMDPATCGARGPDDPVERDRITPLGWLLRCSHVDELPQILNVYRGDMSLIGPRPDHFRHAHHYVRAIPGYQARHRVRPGISGLAQIELGYAEGMDATRLKTMADLDYIRRASFRLDLWIFWRTIVTVVRLRGA